MTDGGTSRSDEASAAIHRRFLVDLHAPGATPLDVEERDGLRYGHVRTHGELNALEAANIMAAESWVAGWRKRRDVLSEAFLRTLHKQMFGQTWTWAGQYRQTMKNISPFPAHEVPIQVRNLLADVRAQHADAIDWASRTSADPKEIHRRLDEIGARYHHRLVLIHPWFNGNGRHARMATDLALIAWGRARFSWGATSSLSAVDTRAEYLRALRAADGHDYAALYEFVRS